MEASSYGSGTDVPPAAYFQLLTIENLRCFGPTQPLQLIDKTGKLKQWTIILGENGVGKTTLLQLLALQRPRPRTIEVHDRTVLVPEAYERIAWPYGPGAEFGMKDPQRDLQIGSVITIGDRLSTWTGQHQKLHNIVTTKTLNRGWSSEVSDNISAFACFGYGASRRMGTVSLYDDNRPDACASLFSDTAELLSPIEWLLTTDYSTKIESDQTARAVDKYKKVESALLRLLPGIEGFRFVPSPETGKVRVEANFERTWVPVNQLSLGYQTSMTWIVDLADRLINRYPNSNDSLAEPAVVLIDEIDLHVHPQWQRQIIQQLTDIFKNTQFIVTAHSPQVVQAAQDANIVLLRREGDHVVIENSVQEIRNWRVDQILTSDLFGLPSTRPPQLDAAIEERASILTKPELTERDEARLQELQQEIGSLPSGDTPEDIEAMDVIRRAAKLLQQSGSKYL